MMISPLMALNRQRCAASMGGNPGWAAPGEDRLARSNWRESREFVQHYLPALSFHSLAQLPGGLAVWIVDGVNARPLGVGWNGANASGQ